MPKKKIPVASFAKGKKTIMHPYELQSLSQSQFIRVANQTLRGEFRILPFRAIQTATDVDSARKN